MPSMKIEMYYPKAPPPGCNPHNALQIENSITGFGRDSFDFNQTGFAK